MPMLAPIIAQGLEGSAGIRHGFFTRHGGVSQGIYASLNCGLGSRDDATAVRENRARVAAHLQVASLITAHPDATLTELRAALPTTAALSTLWRTIDRLGFTLKKNGTRRRTATT